MKTNQRIREVMETYNIRTWELGKMLGVSETTAYRQIREELPAEKQDEIISIILNSDIVKRREAA